MKRMCLLPALLITLVSMSLPILLRALAEPTRQNELTRQEKDPGAPKLVSFPSGDLTLHGFLYKPEGEGPFPAIIWNHGSEKLPGQQPELGRFYTKQGFVFFTPHRHGQGRSPGAYIEDLIAKYAATEKNGTSVGKYVVKLQEEYNQDVVAAVEWLKGQPFVDQQRMVMSGCSYGGVQTLLAAEKGLGIRAFAPFAPAAKSWANTELRKRLLEAVRNAKSPLFLIQARNDFSIEPSEVLGPVIKRKGPPNQAKVYPPYGTTPQEGHYAFATKEGGIAIWGSEVLDFFRAASQ
ncbi:MAG TPA: prolyl oligopeptidase family serine peptidase [Blastocatellia bacterium]|nr:prolyl oligopeptidase family serine peptidase [Blastocatellia bacterium]